MARFAHALSIILAVWIGLIGSPIGVSFLADEAQAADVLRVAYAGSMGEVMDQFIGPAFAKANGVECQGIGQGAAVGGETVAGRCVRSDNAGTDRHPEKCRHGRHSGAGGEHADGDRLQSQQQIRG
jgi:hypothetical protein